MKCGLSRPTLSLTHHISPLPNGRTVPLRCAFLSYLESLIQDRKESQCFILRGLGPVFCIMYLSVNCVVVFAQECCIWFISYHMCKSNDKKLLQYLKTVKFLVIF